MLAAATFGTLFLAPSKRAAFETEKPMSLTE
jgi:hypothetical protein